MSRWTGFIVVVFVVAVPALIYTQTMSDYCSVPPYITRSVAPNIIVIVDNSSAMLDPAYAEEFNSSNAGDYVGYFKPDKTYCASGSRFYEAASCSGPDKGPYPGGLLNWAAMSRYDIVMRILIGGKGSPDPSSRKKLAGENTDWDPKTTDAYPGCIFDVTERRGLRIISDGSCKLPLIEDPYGTPVVVEVSDYEKDVSPRGIMQDMIDRNRDGAWDKDGPRIGVMRFQASNNDIKTDYCAGNTDTVSAFIDKIASDNSKPDKKYASAPLGTAIKRAIDYYKNSCMTACGSCTDPVDSVPCRKNFILTVGSGDATDTAEGNRGYLYDQILESHVSDIRGDRPGKQIINYYTIHIAGSPGGADFLKNISKFGGFVDTNGNGNPDLTSEWDMNRDNIPDTYYEAERAEGIQAAMATAFQDILERASSGTSVAAISTASRGAGSVLQSYFLPGRYEGFRQVIWTGYLQNIWLDPSDNLREDSLHDFKLVLNEDMVMRYYFNPGSNETEVALFTTGADGNGGTFADCSNPVRVPLTNIHTIWEAGRLLALKSPSERTIFTSRKIIRDHNVIQTFPDLPFPEFTTGMNDTLQKALNPDSTYTADKIVRYIRGECLETVATMNGGCGETINPFYRDRRVTVDGGTHVWKLGDIISSSPKVLDSMPLHTYHIDYADRSYYEFISDDTYKRRAAVAFVGANDGMLHAFRAGYLKDTDLAGRIKAVLKDFFESGDEAHDTVGEEIWSFIPYNAFPYLKYLADPDYCHLYYTDLPVKVADASINGAPNAKRSKDSWRTVLIGGMRLGGACGDGGTPAMPPDGAPPDTGFSAYFALDVTDPAHPVPLWEFSDTDLGYSTSMPAIARAGDSDKNGDWYVVFGSGPKALPQGAADMGRNRKGYVYILNLGTGDLVKKVSLSDNAIVGDMLSVDADRDYLPEKIYFGTAYGGTTWKGKIMSLDIVRILAIQTTDIAWNDSFGRVVFNDNYPFTASPEAARDPGGHIWLFIGSGKYYSESDETDTARQIFIGIKDRGITLSKSDLSDVTNQKTEGEAASIERQCTYDPEYDRFSLQNIVTSIKPISPKPGESPTGWVLSLRNGERVLSRPLVIGGLADFITYIPDTDPCTYGGTSYLYSVQYNTGAAPLNIAVRSPEITTETGNGNVTVNKSIRLGMGAPPTGEAIMITRPKETPERLKKKIQVATGSVVETENNPLFSISSRIMHWLKK
jgi:type IV pilus assembly protein PilY1